MREIDVLVVGAGPTGLGAAWRAAERGLDHLVVEAGAGPGGMAASVTDPAGFTWDLGGHVLHSHFEHFDAALAAAGVRFRQPRRNGWVWIGGELVRTPIQQQLTALPTDLRPDAPSATLADFYRNHCGNELTERFFRPFTEKMWATPLELIGHEWTSLRNGSAEPNVPVLKVADGSEPPVVTFPYPEGGTGRLWEAIAGQLDADRLRYRTAVRSIDPATRLALLSDGETVRFRQCVSSMPLPALLAAADGLAALAERAAVELRHCETYVFGLGFDGAPPAALADKSWLYCPDPEVAWQRATVLSNYDPANAGPGRWSVLFEVGRSEHRTVPNEQARQSILDSAVALGADLGRLVSEWDRVVPMGYPVPTLGRDDLLREVDAALLAHGIHSRGRFGGWRYESCNQDYSWAQGVQAVDAGLDGVAEDVYWNPGRY
ncbi:MAG TPA: FAD-dependent oxidoreductase [Jatrophihabitans sp.]|nr:FAD-dependent oxidoreductase [Jatrophihabitans sp.]